MNDISIISRELDIRTDKIEAVLRLFDEGATVPFIARYRKEMTGSLTEVEITKIKDRSEALKELNKRKETIISSLQERDILTDELENKITNAENMTVLEDIYLPYRQKRKTRAGIAKEKGLEPLAEKLFSQGYFRVNDEAKKFVNTIKEVSTVDDAIDGAVDIIAEWISEDINVRESVRDLFRRQGSIFSKVVKGKEEEGDKFTDYFNWDEKINRIPGHRLLAIFRGKHEGILSAKIRPPEDYALINICRIIIKNNSYAAEIVERALVDSYKRLIMPSIENEITKEMKDTADNEAIEIFAENLRELLLQSPLGQKSVMALDPGFRTGAKLVCLSSQGVLSHNETVFPVHNDIKLVKKAENRILDLCNKYKIEAIAIGNGTAGRETEQFINSINLPSSILIVMVNESGASIYSASEIAREEFKDYDITVRGAVSIGRRLMDPLAELVKIDPKSIGVGQYQHDVDQSKLKKGLQTVVESCVNSVGVEINTASKELLSSVSGIGPTLAQNIVDYRNENGVFKDKKTLKKVKRLGVNAFLQAAGFIRIHNAKNSLDASAVHPESYPTVLKMAKDMRCSVNELVDDDNVRKNIDLQNYITDKIGLPTLNDIMSELEKPGRDPREEFEVFTFAEGVNSISDLSIGMELPGIVTNVTKFGAFVDIGVHQDGLVHISQLADIFVSNPVDIVKVSQKVSVRVLEVDEKRKRISLSMKKG